jgi:O-antigen/teichoic acid export membrane protein
MSIYKKFAKDVGIVAVSEIIIKFRPLIFLPIITKALGASDYGVYTTLLITVALLASISLFGLTSSLIRFLPSKKDRTEVSEVFSSISSFVLLASIIIAALVSLSSDFLADTVFGEPSSSNIIRIGIFLLPLTVMLDVIYSFFAMRRRMLEFSLVKLADAFIPVVLTIIFILNGFGLLFVIYASMITQLALILITLPRIIKELGVSLPTISRLMPYLKFGVPLVVVGLSANILNLGNRYVVGALMDSAAVGIFSVAYNLGGLVIVLLFPITSVLLSPLSKAYDEGELKQVRTYLGYSTKYFLMLAIPAVAGLSIVASPVIHSLTTSEFLVGSVGVTAVIAISNLAYGLYVINSQILLLTKKTKLNAILLLFFAIANIALNVILVPSFGIFGSAISTLICFIALYLFTLFYSRSHVKIPMDFLFLAKCVFAAVMMGIVVNYMAPRGWINISLAAAVGAAIYFGLLFLLKAFKKHELAFFRNFLKKHEVAIE